MIKFGKPLRLLMGAAIVAGGILGVPTHAHAAVGSCITDYSGDELNPIVAQSDLLAVTDSSRTYADIQQACATAGATNSVTRTMGSVLPSSGFPTAPQGDLGVTYQFCADANGPIASNIVQIGVGHRGGPVFDGPYPPSQGWKICSYLTIQAATPNDYGMEIFDPVGNFTFFDFPSIPGFPAPTISGNTVTLNMPSTMCFTVGAPSAPEVGIARTDCDPFFNGTNLQNIVVETEVQAEATLPFPVCINENPPGISCNGNETIGPIFGVAGLLVTSDWAPGKITCSTPIIGCSSAGTPASSPTAAGNGLDIGLLPIPPELQAIETCVNPLAPGPSTVPPADNGLVTCGAQAATWTYNPCQAGNGGNNAQDQGDLYTITSKAGAPCPVTSVTLAGTYTTIYGRIYPNDLPTVLGFTIGPSFLTANGWGV